MRTPDQALSWLENQRKSPTQDWTNMCESLCRQAYGLPAHFSSAELHANAIPSGFKHGHEAPSKGDIVLYKNGRYGHIVIATGVGWGCYTNDYPTRGKVNKISDLRDLVSWCGATSWFVADAWWSSTNYIRTHGEDDGDMPLSEDDLNKIAARVWGYKNPNMTDRQAYSYLLNIPSDVWGFNIKAYWDQTLKPAASMLNQTNFYGILAGLIGKVPANATSSPNSDTTAKKIFDAASTDTGGGSGGASAAQIADAVADELQERLES